MRTSVQSWSGQMVPTMMGDAVGVTQSQRSQSGRGTFCSVHLQFSLCSSRGRPSRPEEVAGVEGGSLTPGGWLAGEPAFPVYRQLKEKEPLPGQPRVLPQACHPLHPWASCPPSPLPL